MTHTMTIEERQRLDPKAWQRPRVAAIVLAVCAFASALGATPAGASKTRFFQETFGSAEQPTLSIALGMAVDSSSGDLLVADNEAKTVSRYQADGTPSNFPALGTNVIDAKGGGECPTVPADCDQTPQNGFAFDSSGAKMQIAVDNSGKATDGNIYVNEPTAAGGRLIDIFSQTGEYLGQLTGSGVPTQAFGEPCGVAVDNDGNVYVADSAQDKVHKFVPSGVSPANTDWVQSFAISNPCAVAAGADDGEGSLFVIQEGTGQVHKLNTSTGETQDIIDSDQYWDVAVDPISGHLFVVPSTFAGGGPVKEYDASGTTFITSFAAGPANGSKSFQSLGVAVKPGGDRVYVAFFGEVDVYGPLVPYLPEDVTTGSATNVAKAAATFNGTLIPDGLELTECYFEWGETTAYGSKAPCAETPAEIGSGTGVRAVHAELTGLGAETPYHYRLVAVNPNGTVQAQERSCPEGDATIKGDCQFQTASKPEILATWAENVTLQEATIKAQLNPRSAATTYRFEWGTDASYGNATADIAIGSEPVAKTVSHFLQQLTPGTTYHYRLVAENEIGQSVAPDRTFTTFRPTPPPETDCPNQALRIGAAAFLPDCRAYEMVSPVDKNGYDIFTGLRGNANPGGYVQVASDGDSITYATGIGSFCGQLSSLGVNQYLAHRRPEVGWSCEGIHPPVPGRPVDSDVILAWREFMAFSPDLCSAWLLDLQTPPPTADGQPDDRNLYRRQNCEPGAGDLEPLAPYPDVTLPLGTDEDYVDIHSLQGVSSDSRHALFVAHTKLTPEAASDQRPQIYDRFGDALHLVSVLPGGAPSSSVASFVGSSTDHNLDTAVSPDGSRVYWTAGSNVDGTGKIYLRQHPQQGVVSGECTKATKACTYPVSTGGVAFFWAASTDGSKALFSEGDKLYDFDLQAAKEAKAPRRLIASDVMGVAGVSDDLSRVYFVSTEDLTGAEPNSEGDVAQTGQPNLYLEDDGALRFVGTLLFRDVGEFEPGADFPPYNLISPAPYERATRVTPDGTGIAFESRASLTGYDNTDIGTRAPAVEVFVYEADGALRCVSCNPTGALPGATRELGEPYWGPFDLDENRRNKVRVAAWIPTWEHPLHASNVLSADGNRLFFNSFDPLLPRDTNGVQDVYQWEAPGSGSCDIGDADFFPRNGGCLHLVSSGESPLPSEFWEASVGGRDVFFITASSLLPQDPGLVDLYDARVGGGFPQPIVAASCEGEACQSPPPPPDDPTPSSSSYEGRGNVRESARKRCPKAKRRARRGGKSRCVPRKGKSRGGKHNRRAAR